MSEAAIVGRRALVDEVVALIGSGHSAVVIGSYGMGLSTVMRHVANELRVGRPDQAVRLICLPDARLETFGSERLVVDDAHRGSEPQCLALRDHVLDSPTVLGVRHGACPEALSWLWRSGAAERFDLEPLDAVSIATVIEQRIGGPAHTSLVTGAMKRSGGRPGFVVDEIEALRRSGPVTPRAGFVRDHPTEQISAHLVERAQQLLSEIPTECADAVRLLAMAGSLPIATLERAGVDVVDLQRRQLVEHSGTGRLALCPPALDGAVRATLRPGASVLLARQLLETSAAELAPRNSARLRLSLGGPLELAEIEAAAWTAIVDRSLTSAVALARSATSYGPPGLLVAAEVLTDVGNRAEAADCYAELFVDSSADDTVRARAAVEYATLLLWDLGRPDEAVEVAAGLTTAAVGGPFAAPAAIHEAAMTMYSGRPAAALGLLAAVDDTALDEEWRRVHRLVSVVSAAFVDPDEPTPGDVEYLTRRVDVDIEHSFGAAVGVIAVELSYEFAGECAAAAEVVARARLDPQIDTTPVSSAWLALADARSQLATGRHSAARRAALEAATYFADINHPSGLRWGVGAALLASAMAGDANECRALLERFHSLERGAPFLDADLVRAEAWAAWALRDRARASALFAEAASLARDVGSSALESVALHDSYRLLAAPVGRRLNDLANATQSSATTLRARHVALASEQDAAALCELAIEFERRGALLLAAEVAGDAATIAESQGKRSTARAAAGQSSRLAERCGHPATPALAAHRSTPLTRRERDIAGRAAEGASSRRIANDLGLSIRTVDNVLQRVYIKLGIHGRRDLAELATTSRD